MILSQDLCNRYNDEIVKTIDRTDRTKTVAVESLELTTEMNLQNYKFLLTDQLIKEHQSWVNFNHSSNDVDEKTKLAEKNIATLISNNCDEIHQRYDMGLMYDLTSDTIMDKETNQDLIVSHITDVDQRAINFQFFIRIS